MRYGSAHLKEWIGLTLLTSLFKCFVRCSWQTKTCIKNYHRVPILLRCIHAFQETIPHQPLLSPKVWKAKSTMGATSGAGTATLPEYLSSPPVFSGVRVTRSLVLCVCFVDRCLSFCPFSFGHCVICSSIYGF